jgi:hypothetical protein
MAADHIRPSERFRSHRNGEGKFLRVTTLGLHHGLARITFGVPRMENETIRTRRFKSPRADSCAIASIERASAPRLQAEFCCDLRRFLGTSEFGRPLQHRTLGKLRGPTPMSAQ